MVDSILRCRVDGYRAFDRRDFARHMTCHWEEIRVEVREIGASGPQLVLKAETVEVHEEDLANQSVTSGMATLFGDESAIV